MRASSFAVFAWLLVACGGASRTQGALLPKPVLIQTSRVIVTKDYTTTEAELARKAEIALLGRHFKEAADDFEVLVAFDPAGPNVEGYLMDLATAYEGLELRAKARDRYREIAERFPTAPDARTALIREATLDAYLEDWTSCGESADRILQRADIDDVDRIVALGARTLSLIEVADPDVQKADKTVLQGIDLAEKIHYAAADVLPIADAQLRFALGEVRRVKSEQINLANLPIAEFTDAFNSRAQGVLDAQHAFAEAVHSVDPHWALMASLRVGEMYAKVHQDLVALPPPPEFKTDHDKDLFYAFMHVRFRAILEKGLHQIDDTIALAGRIHDESGWVERAKQAKKDMETALAEEKEELAKFPFTEAQIEAHIEELAKQP